MVDCHNGGESIEPGTWAYSRQYPAYSSDSPAAGTKAPWTSARCHRLLRPLSSKIALLRKERQTASNHHGASRGLQGSSQSSTSASDGISQYQTRSDSILTIEGGGWECSPRPRKKIRRTYVSKARRQEIMENGEDHKDPAQTSYSSRDAVIGLPPCFSEASAEGVPAQPECSALNSKHLRKGTRKFYQGPYTSSGKLLDGIYKGLEALLQATTSSSPPTTKCRSLFSTCLRQVPRYITEEETLASIDDPDNDFDISSGVYNDLEGVGPVSNGGWKPLREVVRAHGLHVIGTAIEEGLLENTATWDILALCLRLGAHEEAQHVLEYMTSALKCPGNMTVIKTSRSRECARATFTAISGFAARTQRHGFLYRQTAAMLDSGALTHEWIGSQAMIECWNGAIQSIAQGDDHAPAATTLLRMAVLKSYQTSSPRSPLEVHGIRLHTSKESRRPKLRSAISSQEMKLVGTEGVTATPGSSAFLTSENRSHSAISNVVTVLSAISLLSMSEPALASQNATVGSTRILHDLALEARQRLELASRSIESCGAPGLFFECIHLPLLAAGLSSMASRRSLCQLSFDDYTEVRELSALPTSHEFATKVALFLCTLAQCCATARSRDAFEFIQPMINDLLNVANYRSQDKALRSFCGSIALATAFAFSEETSQPDHLDWALEVELALNSDTIGSSKPAIEKTPARGSTRSNTGYRWEEGICEWIAKTPAVTLRNLSGLRGDTIEKCEIAETPTSSLKQELPLLSGLSPSTKRERPSRDAGRPACGEVAAVRVCIKAKAGQSGDHGASEKLRFKDVYGRSEKKIYPPKALQSIYLDDDLDELSTPESSQERPAALSTLIVIPNRVCGAKRKRHLNMNASKSSEMVKRLLTKDRELYTDTLDAEDELSAL